MKALIIGSEGNIGKPLVKHLQNSGYETLEVDIKPGHRPGYMMGDINQPIDILPAFDWSPDVVFMLSAMVSRVTCEQASSLAVSTNLAGLNNVIQLTKRNNCMCVYFSTSEVYGPKCEIMSEELSDPEPNNRYGLTKLLGEKLVEYEVRTHNLRAVTLRPFMMYDENEDFGDHRSAMIRFAYNLALDRSIEVHEGSERGWLHVSDAVKAIERAAHCDQYSIINIGSSEIVSIMQLAQMIRERLGKPESLIVRRELPTRMTLSKRPTLDRMEEILGVTAQIKLEVGVDRVCQRVQALKAEQEI